MSGDDKTTVSVLRCPTKRRLNRRLERIDEERPNERVSMDDVIQSLLDDSDALEEARQRIEELERVAPDEAEA